MHLYQKHLRILTQKFLVASMQDMRSVRQAPVRTTPILHLCPSSGTDRLTHHIKLGPPQGAFSIVTDQGLREASYKYASTSKLKM